VFVNYEFCKDVEESGRGLTAGISQHFPGGWLRKTWRWWPLSGPRPESGTSGVLSIIRPRRFVWIWHYLFLWCHVLTSVSF